MRLKLSLFVLCILLTSFRILSQENGTRHQSTCIHPLYDLSANALVNQLDIKVSSKDKKEPLQLVREITLGVELTGGNAFKIDSIVQDVGFLEIKLSVYQLTRAELHANDELFASKNIYVFSDLPLLSKSEKTFFINQRKVKLSAEEFYSYEVSDNEDVTIDTGGLLGSQHHFQPKGESIYLVLGGPKRKQLNPDQFGVAFTTRSLGELDKSVGRLLIQIFTEIK